MQVTRTVYSQEFKSIVLAKAVAPNAPGVVELSKEFNIPINTLYTWIATMRKNKNKPSMPSRPKDKSAEFKLQAVISTASMSDEEKNAYCRENGIYPNGTTLMGSM